MGTSDKGIILNPNDHSFKVFADADFCGLWNTETAPDDPSTAKSRSGYIVMYGGCPIVWKSQLIQEVCLSTTEAEYVSLSQALRETIFLMGLLNEFKEHLSISSLSTVPMVRCTAFEDNSGAVELARLPKMRPRTKHINVKYHHFRSHVFTKLIEVLQVTTTEQLADIFTKNLGVELFVKHRKRICGW